MPLALDMVPNHLNASGTHPSFSLRKENFFFTAFRVPVVDQFRHCILQNLRFLMRVNVVDEDEAMFREKRLYAMKITIREVDGRNTGDASHLSPPESSGDVDNSFCVREGKRLPDLVLMTAFRKRMEGSANDVRGMESGGHYSLIRKPRESTK